jgi:putative methyltransferase
VRKISYSTCSIYAEENEHVVTTLLKKHWPTWKLTPRAKVLPTWHRRGYPSEVCDIPGLVSTDEDRAKIADCVVRAVPGGPEGDLMNGFFVACFERVGKNSLPGLSPVWKGPSIGGSKRAHEEVDEMDDTTTGAAATDGTAPAKKKKKNKKKKKKTTTNGGETSTETGHSASGASGASEGDKVEDDEASDDDE